MRSAFVPNQAPEVRLTQAPVSTTDKYFYAYRMNWVGYDPDGKVDHFLIAVDPARPDSVDGSWQATTKNEQIVFFKASQPDTLATAHPDTATDFHVFAVAAVDNNNPPGISKPVYRAFFAYNVAPQVTIDSPRPRAGASPAVPPAVRIHWRGVDPDGQFTQRPVKYKYKLFETKNGDFPEIPNFVSFLGVDPNFLRRKYAPTFGPSAKCPTCSVWDSTSAETTEVQFTNLVPQRFYMFAVTGFDEAGAYDPLFHGSRNLLSFFVTYAGLQGPRICMFSDFFFFCYDNGGYLTDPNRFFRVEIPDRKKVTFRWDAIAAEGAEIRRFRWVMDPTDLSNDTPRTDEENDITHWSSPSLTTKSATIGPFTPGPNDPKEHFFFVEAEDNNGLKSLGIIDFTVVRATFDKEILVVNDTRFSSDNFVGGELLPPAGVWPTSSEVDTFLYAVGGMPYKGYPPGSVSPAGVFSGYPIDTTNTREFLTGITPLSKLGQYKKVIWFTDAISATYIGLPTDPYVPTTSLRLMSSPGQPNTLSTYALQGGEIWLMGGGAALANLGPWDKRGSDPNLFSSSPDLNELISGRMMYDFAKWQSAVRIGAAVKAAKNDAAIPGFPGGPPLGFNTPLPGLAKVGRGWVGQPEYSKLPLYLLPKGDPPADTPVPQRYPDSFFYLQDFFAEFLVNPNFIREDLDPGPGFDEQSTLD
ncbi:MAG: hypothetical protein E6K78_06610, partial [Candidatus Eisenbacteria bacterium]